MSSSIVIKVQYGEKLRRFNALVKEDENLDLNMEGLKLKICSLFNLPPDADFTLTYLDEDEDEVTLVDDEDLHDVMIQGLNPVWMTLHMDPKKAVPSCTSSSQTLPQNSINQTVAEILKSLPELLRGAMSVLPHRISSGSSNSHELPDMLCEMLKFEQSYPNSPYPYTAHTVSNPDEVHDNPKVTSKASISEKIKSNGIGSSCFASFRNGKDTTIQHSAGNSAKQKDKEIIGDRRVKYEASIDDLRKFQIEEILLFKNAIENFQQQQPYLQVKNDVISSDEPLDSPPTYTDEGMGLIFHKDVSCDSCGVLPITGPRFKSKVNLEFDLCDICFKQMRDQTDYTYLQHRKFCGSYNNYGDCSDGCGFHLAGPLLKSKVKVKFDLCNTCFARIGHRRDYVCFNFPMPGPLEGYDEPALLLRSKLRYLSMLNLHDHEEAERLRSGLDNHFIMDVNVMEGTIMAASTPFTKIWRMRNTGARRWSRGLQLVWTGFDRFNPSNSIEIEIPEDGVSVGDEVDIAVDCIAPERPGRYISFWMMADRSGNKFGQHMPIQILVDASLKHSTKKSSPSLNLNLPPETSKTMAYPYVNFVPPVEDIA